MKSYFLSIFLLCTIGAKLSAQTTYYSRNTTTNFNTLSGWAVNRDGTGANPPNLNNSIRLVVQNGHTKTTSATATVNRLTIETGGTVTASHAITLSGSSRQFEIENGGTYIHDNTSTLSSSIFNGTEVFGRTSNFQINRWQSSSTSITPASLDISVTSPLDGNDYYYGNLIINWQGSGNWNQDWPSYPTATYLTAGDWTINSVGDFRFTQTNNRQPDVYIAGNFVMNSTGTGSNRINFSTGNNGIGYINVNGNVTHSNGTITASAASSYGFIWTYGSSTSTWHFSGGTRNKLAYMLTGTKVITLSSNLNMGTGAIGSKMQINSSTTVLDLQQYTISDGTSGNYITNGGTIRTAHANGLWTNGQTNRGISNSNGLYLQSSSNSTIVYNGAANQVVSSLSGAGASYDSYENLSISGANTKIAEGNITVDGVFNFSAANNYLNIGQHTVTIENGGSISNAGNTAYFITGPTTATNGRLRQNGLAASARIFPIGTASSYLPARVTPSSSGSDFSVSVFRGTTIDGLPSGTAFGSRGMQVDAVWRVDRPSGAANATLRYDWMSNTPEGAGFTASPNAQIGIWRYQGSNWILTPPGSYTSDNTSNFSTTTSAVTSFGTAGTGYAFIVANINVLPGRLLSFAGSVSATDNLLKWEVADPSSYARFELEESTNGQQFRKSGETVATLQTSYTYTDRAVTAKTKYYRLKMWDLFNQATYSYVITINRTMSSGIVLLQNPVQDGLVFRHPSSEKAMYMVTDMSGRVYLKGMIAPNTTQSNLRLSNLPAGTYVLRYMDQAVQHTQTFIKQ